MTKGKDNSKNLFPVYKSHSIYVFTGLENWECYCTILCCSIGSNKDWLEISIILLSLLFQKMEIIDSSGTAIYFKNKNG